MQSRFRFLNIYKQKRNPLDGVEQMDFTSFSRTSALTNGGFGSIFLFTIGTNTFVFPLLQQSVFSPLQQSVFFPSSTICIFSSSKPYQDDQHCVHQACEKLAEKELRQASKLSQGLIVVFVFLSPAKKQKYTFKAHGTAVKKQKYDIPSNTSYIAVIQNYDRM